MENIFSNNWFEQNAKAVWDTIIPLFKPKKILEIGSYEGASICYLIEKLGSIQDLEIHAIDSWEGGQDHISKEIGMSGVEDKFKQNIKNTAYKASKRINIKIHKGFSDKMLCKLIVDGYENQFDLIYVDGSHETSDTLCDMILSFKLLKSRGMMIVDDYLWQINQDVNFRPKIAIDAFVNMHLSKLDIMMAPNSQVYLIKK